MLIQGLHVTGHRFPYRQRKALTVALDVANQIPFVDDADDAAVFQHRQLRDVVEAHTREDGRQGIVRRGGDGCSFVVAQSDKIAEIAARWTA